MQQERESSNIDIQTIFSESAKNVYSGTKVIFNIYKAFISSVSDVIKLKNLYTVLNEVSSLSESELINAFKLYTNDAIINILKNNFTFNEFRSLYGLLIWLSNNYASYGKIMLDISFDPETNDFQFVNFVIPDCDWNAWRVIAREVKTEMRKSGLSELASKVAIVCLRGLTE